MRLSEVERKYDVPSDFALPDLSRTLDDIAVDEPVVQRLTATYYDTAELTLARHRVTLRYRTGGTDAGWHVKRPAATGAGGSAVAGRRTEIHHPRRPGRRIEVPDAFDEELVALRRGRVLEPVVRLTTHRISRTLRGSDGTTLATLVDDRVTVRMPDGQTPPTKWRELEVELADGKESVLDAVEKVLRAAGARPAAAESKLARAMRDRLPPDPNHSRAWRPVADYALAQRETIIALDPAVRRDEPEAVHDMRVAIRRLRSTLRTFRSLLPTDRSEPVRTELSWLAGELGPMRDLEVISERLTAAVDAEPAELVVGPVVRRLRDRFGADVGSACATALASLDSARYFALLDELDGLLDAPPARKPVGSELGRLVRRTVVRTDRQLAAAATTDVATDDTALHEARKTAKRARYAVEVLQPAAGKPAERMANRLKQVQDVLGTYQDTVVAREVLHDEGLRAHAAGDSAFTFGVLHARQREAAAATLTRLPEAHRRLRSAARRWPG